MENEQFFALRQLIRKYGLQIDYLKLLVSRDQVVPDEAQEAIEVMFTKMAHAAERLCQLRLEQQLGQPVEGRPIDPSLILDLHYR